MGLIIVMAPNNKSEHLRDQITIRKMTRLGYLVSNQTSDIFLLKETENYDQVRD